MRILKKTEQKVLNDNSYFIMRICDCKDKIKIFKEIREMKKRKKIYCDFPSFSNKHRKLIN